MDFRKKRKKHLSLDITPIVDTVFNLIIFFALSLNFVITPGIKLNLPKSSAKEIVRDQHEIIIFITEKEDIYFNQDRVDLYELTKKMKAESLKGLHAHVIIQADEKVSHGKVVQVMEVCRKNGFNRIAIATHLHNDRYIPY